MKICISATGKGLDAEVDPRFGRCQYFTIVDPDTMQFESIENSSISASGGAGIQAAQFVANKGVEFVLTGNAGPNAYNTLQAAGVSIITGVAGKVREAVEGYKNGKLRPLASGPSVDAHFGMGMGRGGGMGPGQPSKVDELTVLKEESQVLRSQLEKAMDRIDKLEERGNPVNKKQTTGISDVKEALKKKG
ncbi:MAG: NifB/NifX family molybdenum-iron cluster-binding protein [Thermodesulfobacteriota bacterium]